MSRLTPEQERERGRDDYRETKNSLIGEHYRTPWKGAFESDNGYEEKLKAYKQGFDETKKHDEERKP